MDKTEAFTGAATEAEISVERETIDEHLRRYLGRLADYAVALSAEGMERQPPSALIGALEDMRNNIGDLITTLQRLPDGPIVHDAPTPAQPERHVEVESPESPFYQRIIRTDEIPVVQPRNSQGTIEIAITGDRTISVDGQEKELDGDLLYLFNALLHMRSAPASSSDFMKFGFREGRTFTATRFRYRAAIERLQTILRDLVPTEFPEPIIVKGQTRAMTRVLHPDIVIADQRPSDEVQAPEDEVEVAVISALEPTSNTVAPAAPEIAPAEVELGTENTAEQIAVYIKATYGTDTNASDVEQAAAADSHIQPAAPRGGVQYYSFYAAQRIIRAIAS